MAVAPVDVDDLGIKLVFRQLGRPIKDENLPHVETIRCREGSPCD